MTRLTNVLTKQLKNKQTFYRFSIVMVVCTFILLTTFVLINSNTAYAQSLYHVFYFGFEQFVSFYYLPFVLIGLPIIGAIIQCLINAFSERLRDGSIIITSFFVLLTVIGLYPSALLNNIVYEFPSLLGLGMSFHVDMLAMVMLVLTSVVWFFVMVYSHEYVMFEEHRNRFYVFMAITYSAILGTIMAGDLLTMFLFFEIMTFSSYMLVTHVQKKECFSAGYNYIFMGLIGGLAILLAIILMYSLVGTVTFTFLASEMANLGGIKYVIIVLLIFGFGIKAGMAPVHVWLPKAHPIAPTPASALLSGVMIKIGAFGILRVTTSYLFPTLTDIQNIPAYLWVTSQNLGFWIIWLGIITMAIGVFFALQQSNMKKMLAYHSISQMGYIVLGIGVTLYLGTKGAMGYSGALYHIVNHALFKSLLFMVAGVVYLHTHELNMYKLGGLYKKLPVTALICLIACLGITGMPLFNGFASKSLLHHAIIESYQYGHSSFFYAEMMFNVISAGTVCSFIKLFSLTFLGKLPEKYEKIQSGKFKSMHLAMGGLAFIIIFVGVNPSFIMNSFILVGLAQLPFDPSFVGKYIVGINFFNSSDMLAMIPTYALGATIFFAGMRFHWFHLSLPKWINIEYVLAYPFEKLMSLMCKLMGNCGCDEEVKELEHKAFNIIKSSPDEELTMTQRIVSTASIFSNRYEENMLKNDVLIYVVGLTIVLVALMIVG